MADSGELVLHVEKHLFTVNVSVDCDGSIEVVAGQDDVVLELAGEVSVGKGQGDAVGIGEVFGRYGFEFGHGVIGGSVLGVSGRRGSTPAHSWGLSQGRVDGVLGDWMTKGKSNTRFQDRGREGRLPRRG